MSEELVTVATVPDASLAAVLCASLETEGIRAFAANAEIAAMNWALTNAVGGVHVQVAAKDASRARNLLDEARREQIRSEMDEDEDPDYPEAPPPNAREDLAQRAFRAALMGLIFFPLQFYAIWLLWNVIWEEGELRPAARRSAWLAGLLLIPILTIIAVGTWLGLRPSRPPVDAPFP